tara:strand:- start:427 stop:723 length:297 start_codon:yes stop_codon:yes gene_type:complete
VKFFHASTTHEGDHYVTTHLTEEGALRAAIFDVMEFMGLEDGEERMNRDQDVDLVTDHKVIMEASLDQLRRWWPTWYEETWDNPYSYDVQITTSSLQA